MATWDCGDTGRERGVTGSEKPGWFGESYNHTKATSRMSLQIRRLFSSHSSIFCQLCYSEPHSEPVGKWKPGKCGCRVSPCSVKEQKLVGKASESKQTTKLTFEDTLCNIWAKIHISLSKEKFLPRIEDSFAAVL